jgi:hypothetical protein
MTRYTRRTNRLASEHARLAWGACLLAGAVVFLACAGLAWFIG